VTSIAVRSPAQKVRATRIYTGPGPRKGQKCVVIRNTLAWTLTVRFSDGHVEVIHRRRLKSGNVGE
jgi:hypothetical protein